MKTAIEKVRGLLDGELRVVQFFKGSVTIDWRQAEAEIKAEVYKKCLDILEKEWEAQEVSLT